MAIHYRCSMGVIMIYNATRDDLITYNGIVYRILNIINGKSYIGQTTKSFKKRYNLTWWNSTKLNIYLKRSVKKYKRHNFIIQILVINKSDSELDIWEDFYIKYFRTNNKIYGYNLKGGGHFGHKFSEEAKDRMSSSHILTIDKFIKICTNIHLNKYSYERVSYKRNSGKIEIFCKECQMYFWQDRGHHIRGYGCKRCGMKEMHKVNTKGFRYFKEEIDKKFNSEFEFDEKDFIDGRTKITIKHKECGYIFEQSLSKLRCFKVGCKRCACSNNGKLCKRRKCK